MTDEIIYAITDVHGRSDLVKKAYDAIVVNANGRPARVVFLGDAIDRGPDSKGCIDRLIRGADKPNFAEQINLLGNHEESMNDVLRWAVPDENPAPRSIDLIRAWFDNGGVKTILSYGVKDGYSINGLRDALPPSHREWLGSLKYFYETDTHIFVHAGIPPGSTVHETFQKDRRELIWIREPFLSVDFDFGKHVVHGHSPFGIADRRHPPTNPLLSPPHRTNLDNGAVWSGILFVGVFYPGETGRPHAVLKIS